MGKRLQEALVSLAALGVCLPQPAFGVEPAARQPVVSDVALADGGTLHGQVIDLNRGSVAGVSVALRTQDRDVARTTTAADGKFAVQNIRGGVYQVAAGQGHGVYRLWTVGTAPPSARNGAIVYTDNQAPRSSAKMLLTNPIIIGGAIAAAIAVPIAITNSRNSSP